MPSFLRRSVLAAARMNPPDARRVMALLIGCAGRDGMEGRRDGETEGLPSAIVAGARVTSASKAAAYYAKREPRINALHTAIARQLAYAKHETLRNLEHSVSPSLHPSITPSPLAAAEGRGVAADITFDAERFRSELLAVIRAESAETLQTAGSQFFTEAGIDDPFTMPEPRAIKFLDTRENLLSGIPDEIHAAIEAELQAGITAGDSMKQLATRLSSKFTEIEEGRAMTIASTETGAAYGDARQEAMEQGGITHKRWLTSHLPNVRPAHAEAESDPRNEAVPIAEPFHVGGELLMYPGDPAGSPENVINCHCVSLAQAAEHVKGRDADPDLDTILAAYNANQARIPKGQPGAGRFAGGATLDSMAGLGKNVKRGRKMLEDDLAHAKLDTEPDPDKIATALRAKLKVKKPVAYSSKVASISGGTAQEHALVIAHAQELFDMAPPAMARKLPKIDIRIVDRPNVTWKGQYTPASPGSLPLLEINKAQGGVSRETIWHEHGHYFHWEGPPSFRAAVQEHYQRRTFGETMKNNGHFSYKRDEFFNDYAGRMYPGEPSKGMGSELVSTHFEHLASDRAGFYPRAATTNGDKYKETMGVTLSILYHGRTK